MNNKKAERTQVDGKQDEYSLASGLSFEGEHDMTRQEFKDEADINKVLAKFGVFAPQRQVRFGEMDYTIDLQGAIQAVEESQNAWLNLPDEIQEKYPNWQALLDAIDKGEITEIESRADTDRARRKRLAQEEAERKKAIETRENQINELLEERFEKASQTDTGKGTKN